MSKQLEYIIRDVLSKLVLEQEQPDNQQNNDSMFSPQEQRFLGSFAAAGSEHLGILYSISEIGVREFVARSGKQYGCTPAILLSMLRNKYIKIVPYTGYGRNTDYTIELQLPLESVEQFASLVGKKDGEEGDLSGTDMEGGAPMPSGGGGGGGGGGLPPMDTGMGGEDEAPAGDEAGAEEAPAEEPTEEPAPEVAHVVKYGDLLRESVMITKQLLNEASKSKKKVQKPRK
jgi:hypothetical protein